MPEEHTDKSPQKSGFNRGNWTGKLVARLIQNKFSVLHTNDGALKLARRLGFSVRKPRPIPYNSATPEGQKEFIEKAKVTVARWGGENRCILVIDGATIQDSPSSKRGRRHGGGQATRARSGQCTAPSAPSSTHAPPSPRPHGTKRRRARMRLNPASAVQ